MTKRNEDGTPHPLRWTPGPWCEGMPHKLKFSDTEVASIYSTHCTYPLADVVVYTGRENLYNIFLMKTAPELYDILEEILENAVVNGFYREKAEKIMAKARGEVDKQ